LLLAADVVIEASRPRALEQLGIIGHDIVRDGPRVWISITGYGRDAAPLAVAFGDDAAAAGGLVAWGEDGQPRFAADAIADPLSGLAAAGAVQRALAGGGRWMIDLPMAGVAAAIVGAEAGRAWDAVPSRDAPPPRPEPARANAHGAGADTDAVLTELGLT
jgi:crotonobetainyl-CoA:carnitine CoA-transferase CaiB-like acyl-CoA transferase